MDGDLISDEDYDKLSADDEQCFAEFEATCRRNMTEMLDDEQRSSEYYQSIKAQYMSSVYSVALECGITSLPQPQYENNASFYESYNHFCLAVQGEVARIRIRGRRSRDAISVQLVDKTKTTIQHYVSRLREAIKASSLPEDRKRTLNLKLDELIDELEKRRLNLGRTMLVLSCAVAGLSGATTIAADGPAALTNIQSVVTSIMKLIGVDKDSEDAAALRLAPPPKALPAPPTPPAKTMTAARRNGPSWDTSGGDLDDEIPF